MNGKPSSVSYDELKEMRAMAHNHPQGVATPAEVSAIETKATNAQTTADFVSSKALMKGVAGTYTQVSGTPANEFEFNSFQAFLDEKINNRFFDSPVTINLTRNITDRIELKNVMTTRRYLTQPPGATIEGGLTINSEFQLADMFQINNCSFTTLSINRPNLTDRVANLITVNNTRRLTVNGRGLIQRMDTYNSDTWCGNFAADTTRGLDIVDYQLQGGMALILCISPEFRMRSISHLNGTYTIGQNVPATFNPSITKGDNFRSNIIDNRPGRPLETYQRKEVYSTDEVDTGKTWIDGKPIFRRVFQGTTPANPNDNASTIGTISNLDTVVKLDGFLRSTSDSHIPISYSGRGASKGTYITSNVNVAGAILVSVESLDGYTPPVSFSGRPVTVIVEYTKQ